MVSAAQLNVSRSCTFQPRSSPQLAFSSSFSSVRLMPVRLDRHATASRPLPAGPRASDLGDSRPPNDEWRPPSDWDKAWKTYKKVPSPSTMGLNKATPGLGSPSAGGGGASSNFGSSRGKSQGSRPSLFIHMEQYVSRSPSRSDFPLSEEVDAVKRTERVALDAWTDQRVTFAGFGAVALLFVYMVVIVGPPPA